MTRPRRVHDGVPVGSEFDEAQSQRLSVLDSRLFNCDRHEGNVLVTGARGGGGRRGIVPIDHAFCLPAFGFFREAEFTWRYWASAAVPFGAEVLHHVASLDVDADVEAARAAAAKALEQVVHTDDFLALPAAWIGSLLAHDELG